MKKPTPAELNEFLSRRVESIVGEKELRKALTSGKPLRIKYGIDLTAPFIHTGHAVNIWMMRQLQDWGHKVVFLVGGMTTRIGDPTGKSETRKEITDAEIKQNAKNFIKQVGKILLTNPKVFEIRDNYDWFGNMKVPEFIKLTGQLTYAQLIERDMFQKRIREGKEIRMHEMLYPIVQGYDSVMLKSDLTIVGNDQLFNEQMGRFYQERFGQKPQAIITTKITPGLDGKEKQSKSLGNYIAIADTANDMFGKVMSLPDDLIIPYFTVYTNVTIKEIDKISKQIKSFQLHPMDAKKLLARSFVELYYDTASADKAEANFVKIFQEHKLPSKIPTHKLAKPTLLLDLLVTTELATSKSEARRLVQQGGVSINERVTNDISLVLTPKTPTVIQVGKRRFLKLI